jgi:hypothetical protein
MSDITARGRYPLSVNLLYSMCSVTPQTRWQLSLSCVTNLVMLLLGGETPVLIDSIEEYQFSVTLH